MEYSVIRSKRKTLSIQVKLDGSVIVRAPRRISLKAIDEIVREKEQWIIKSQDKIRIQKDKLDAEDVEYLTDEEINELADSALAYIPECVRYYADIIGVDYGRITIRKQKTRWGSCSGKGNLNFNCLLMLAPKSVIDYVVVHELCHRKEMNHSRAFWNEVSKIIPDYKDSVMWLKGEGSLIMKRGHRDY